MRPSTRRAQISAVVIAYNRADLIQTCLKALAFADEILVFDKSSTDGTAQLARALADRVTIIPWSPVVEDTRAQAVAACAHEWIVCVDDDECLSVEAVRFIEAEVDAPRAGVYLLPQRHYILAVHDERAYYWPEHQPRFFRRDAVSFKRTVHGGTQYAESDAFVVPFDTGICIHHLSHRNASQWIEKANRYTSLIDRVRVADPGNDLRRFAHQHIDRYLTSAGAAEAGSYAQAVGVLRALYDIVDRLKIWEEERGLDGGLEFSRVCRTLEADYASCMPARQRLGELRDERDSQQPPQPLSAATGTASVAGSGDDGAHAMVALLRDSLQANRAAFERAMVATAAQVSELTHSLAHERAERERLAGQLGQAEREAAAAKAEADRLQSLEARRRSEQDHLRAALESAQQHVAAVHASTSWRITAPLRALVTKTHGVRRRVNGVVSSQSRPRRALLRVLRFGWQLIHGRPRAAMNALRGQPHLSAPQSSAGNAAGSSIPSQPARFLRYDLRVHDVGAGGAPVPAAGGARRVICVSHVLPFPARAGNEYRIHRMLTWLRSDGCDVLLVVCPLEGEDISQARFDEAAAEYPRLLVVHRDGRMSANFGEAKAWLEGVLPRQPRDFSMLVRNSSPQPSAPVEAICRVFCPDVLLELVLALQDGFGAKAFLAEYVFMTGVFGLLPAGVLKMVDTHDVFSTKLAKVARYGIEDGLALSAADEAALLALADVVIGIQPIESQELKALAPRARVVTAGVDFDVARDFAVPPGGRSILLVASGNAMNVKGLQDFLRFGWPIVRRECPDAQLQVVGDVGRALGFAPPGVRLLGRVEDLAAAYAQADVVINPAVAGTGLKIKTIEALCHLRPVVTFPSGADGIGEVARQFLRVAGNWYEFANALVAQLNAPDPARSRAQAETLAAEFAPAQVYAELKKVLDGVD